MDKKAKQNKTDDLVEKLLVWPIDVHYIHLHDFLKLFSTLQFKDNIIQKCIFIYIKKNLYII